MYSCEYNQENNVQIPLAFHTNGSPVQHALYEYSPFGTLQRISFVPVFGLYKNAIKITLNDGAHATLALSTVFLPEDMRRRLLLHDVHFYINGDAFVHMYYTIIKANKSPPKKESDKQTCWKKLRQYIKQ